MINISAVKMRARGASTTATFPGTALFCLSRCFGAILAAMTSPNPDWKPGDSIASPVSEMVTINPADVAARDIYKLLIGAVVPRPIAVVSTLAADGAGNVAPFSFLMGFRVTHRS